MTDDLFVHAAERDPRNQPLAERMRPRRLDDMVGQPKVLGPQGALRRLLQGGVLPSLILWGPPGTGKTTLARLLAAHIGAELASLSAVQSGVKEVRAVVQQATDRRAMRRTRTVLFIDEIHRFNRAQQDALLPHVEAGLLTLVGATTQNPSFEVNAALLSRCRVFVLQALSEAELGALCARALSDRDLGLGAWGLSADAEVLAALAAGSGGDARRALTTLEVASQLCQQAGRHALTLTDVEAATQTKTLLYDRAGDAHYGVVSAFIKSLRGCDPDAAVYYLARMLEAGETPRFILRRMVIFASEDVGNADPRALVVATAALQAVELVGLPEGVLPMTQAATYLACAPKSNSVTVAWGEARAAVQGTGDAALPAKLRNAPTRLMREQGFGNDYHYPHDFAGHYVPEHYLPEALAGSVFYRPSDQGEEVEVAARLSSWRKERP